MQRCATAVKFLFSFPSTSKERDPYDGYRFRGQSHIYCLADDNANRSGDQFLDFGLSNFAPCNQMG